ncbi:MAG: alanine racemase, partial [Gammaproteobacteria bacterium]
MSRRPARLRVHPEALVHNLRRLRTLLPPASLGRGGGLVAVVKADAYGHGLEAAARALAPHAAALAVASPGEGEALRAAGLGCRIVVLQGFAGRGELEACRRLDLEPVIHDPGQVALLEGAPAGRPLAVWLKVDTGMHRLGVAPGEARALWERLRACPAVAGVVLMTHLAEAEVPGGGRTREQLARFREAVAGLPGPRSVANSAALLACPEARGELPRPGIALYGVSPFPEGEGPELGLRPAMTFETRLLAVRPLRRGDPVGYGGSWVCPEDMPVGVVAAGYADGYPRSAPSGTPVLVGGRAVPLVGRVSMDLLCV